MCITLEQALQYKLSCYLGQSYWVLERWITCWLLLFQTHTFKYLFTLNAELQRERERVHTHTQIIHPLVYSQGCNRQGWAKLSLEPGASLRSSMWVQGPMHFCHLVLLCQARSRSWNGSDAARTWTGTLMEYGCPKWLYPLYQQTSPAVLFVIQLPMSVPGRELLVAREPGFLIHLWEVELLTRGFAAASTVVGIEPAEAASPSVTVLFQ